MGSCASSTRRSRDRFPRTQTEPKTIPAVASQLIQLSHSNVIFGTGHPPPSTKTESKDMPPSTGGNPSSPTMDGETVAGPDNPPPPSLTKTAKATDATSLSEGETVPPPPSLSEGETAAGPDNPPPPSPTKTAKSTDATSLSEGKSFNEMDEFRRQTELVRAMFKKDKIPRTPKFDTFIDAVLELIEDAPRPFAMTDREFLESLHIEENEITKPLFEKADRFRGHRAFDIQSAAEDFVLELGRSETDFIENFTWGDAFGNYNCIRGDYGGTQVEIRRIPGAPNAPRDGSEYWTHREAQINQMMQYFGINENSEPSENKLFHGTSPRRANSLMVIGPWENYLRRKSDFGMAFYCSDRIRDAYDYAELNAKRGYGAIMHFDLPQNYLEELEVLRIPSVDVWNDIFRGLCRRHHPSDPTELLELWNRHRILDLDVIFGKMSKRVDDNNHEMDESSDLQVAFRGRRATNKLFADKNRIKIIVFEVLDPPS